MNIAQKMIFLADGGIHVPANTNVEIYCILKQNTRTNQWNALFEVATDNIQAANDECKVRIANNHRNWITSNYDDDGGQFQNVSWFQISYDEWHHISLHGHDFTVDGQTKYTSQTSNTLNQPLCIGGFDYNGTLHTSRVWPGIVGLCQVTENTKLIGRFVPVKEIATEVCGYYDTVSKRFLKSKSSMPFKEFKSA